MRYNTLGIQVTNSCNMECAHCITNSSPRARGDLPWEKIDAAVRSSAPYIDGVCVTGGEPWLRRDTTLKTIRLAHSLGLVVSMISNGYWARTEEEARRVFSELKEAGLDRLAISFDSYHKIHERLTNIHMLDRLLACGSDAGIRLQVQYCGNSENRIYEQLRKIVDVHQVPLLSSRVLPFGRGRNLAVMRNPSIDDDWLRAHERHLP